MNDKAELRRYARSRLETLSPEAIEVAAGTLSDRLWSLPELQHARTLLLYASLPREVPTGEIAREARARGIAVAYPRCFPEGREMSLHVVADERDLMEQGRYGLLEPPLDCPVTRIEEVDFALVPGLAWDRSGHRLGRGAGYYDRLFGSAAWSGFRCGLFFSIQELERIPFDPWDARLDAIVTEQEVVRLP